MLRYLIFIFPILFLQCKGNSDAKLIPEFTSADSTKIVQVILDSLEVEMENQVFMEFDSTKQFPFTSCVPGTFAEVRINKRNQILYRGKIISSELCDEIVEFYAYNLYGNDLKSNFPLYTWLTREQCQKLISDYKNEIERLKTELKKDSLDNSNREILAYYKKSLLNWKEKLKLFSILKKNRIPEVDLSTRINFKYQIDSKFKNQVLDSVLLGYYKIREIDAKDYFKESYAEIFWKATKYSDSLSMERLKAFKVLHPVQVVDRVKYPEYRIPLDLPPVIK